ncbi:MAG: SGNH/GDSL hydrolase family protein [Planctomycetes bacterium]|nr:SGNH/GDSL hydrolase family protein [Planctomycetota bacterium]
MPKFRTVHLLFLVGAWCATGYIVVLPLLGERGSRFLYGYYPLHYVYLGVPLLIVTLLATALLIVPSRRRRSVGLKGGVATLAALVALAAFDLTFSLFVAGAWTPDFWLDGAHISRLDSDADAELGFVRKPGVRWSGTPRGTDRVVHYATDERGFRNPDGTRGGAIAFLGDSYTEAAQVELDDTFVRIVGERLGETVVNYGRGAYGPQQERIVLERYALAGDPKPRVVVWQLFEGNDLTDAEEFVRWRDGDHETVPLRDRFLQNSFFAPLVRQTYRDKRGDYAELRLDDGTELPITLRYPVRRDWLGQRPRGWVETERALREGHELCRAAGVELVVVFLPVAARVLSDRLRFATDADRERILPSGYETDRGFATAVRALCVQLGVRFVDLLPVFRRALDAGADGIYIPRDEHLDLRGHRLVAQALEAVLREG